MSASLALTTPGTTLALLLPEALLALGIPAVLVADMVLPDRKQVGTAWLGILVCVAAAVAAQLGPNGSVDGMMQVDASTAFVRCLIAALSAMVLLLGTGERALADRGAHTVCVLGVALGSSVAAVSANLLPLWLGLEMVSLASYALAAWKGGDRRAAEAGMKFVLFGGLASACTLFGMSHVYGLTGHLDFLGIGAAFASMPVVALAALGLVAVGVAYKLTIVPFHFYAPDVYQGAPALSVAATGIAPKVGALVALARGVQLAVPASLASPDVLGTALAVAAGASLLVAAFTALAQRDAKRILAFSGIGHAGAALLALACLPAPGAVGAALLQLFAYSVATLGALACLAVIERDRGSCRLEALRGVARERPWLAALLCLFVFSLAGVPPLAGFFGKWVVLQQAIGFGLGGARTVVAVVALLLVVSTALSAWAYLLIVRAVVLQPADNALEGRDRVPAATIAVLAVCAGATFAIGFWCDRCLAWIG
jgi:NADH-quinone oxidoreductase subunit N